MDWVTVSRTISKTAIYFSEPLSCVKIFQEKLIDTNSGYTENAAAGILPEELTKSSSSIL